MEFGNKKIFLAPLAGITETVFRSLCRRAGADAVVSEMVSADGLHYSPGRTAPIFAFDERERPFGIQLFGSNPDRIAEAAQTIAAQAKPDFIDLNCGCPVPKIVGKNGGSALLRDLPLFKKIVTALVQSVDLPVTVKLRSGWYEHQWVDIEFAQTAEACGVAAIVLHPRSKTMGFTGHSYWDRIALVKQSVTVPVIGNGDITTAQQALDMFNQTGCDSVMIGRGAWGNPWIFSQIKSLLNNNPMVMPDNETKRLLVLEHIALYRNVHGEQSAAQELKKHLSLYIKGQSGASQTRNRIFQSNSTAALEMIVNEVFNNFNVD